MYITFHAMLYEQVWVIFQENTLTMVRCYFKMQVKSINAFLFSLLFQQDELTPADEREKSKSIKTVLKQNQFN